MTGGALVIAPHPDDEVLGAGGTIARLASSGWEVEVAVVTRGYPPLFDEPGVERVREEAVAAHRLLGVNRTSYLDFPAADLDSTPHHELNEALVDLVNQIRPDLVYVPHPGDLHRDHHEVFHSALVATRPGRTATPRAVYAYETLSETNWNAPHVSPPFQPNTFVDITGHLHAKLDAMRCYASQLKEFPHERSIEAIRALATLRGSTVDLDAAEAFVLVRQIDRR